MLASLGGEEHGHAAGPDGVRTTDLCRSQIDEIAAEIGDALHLGEWHVGGERRVEVPKGTTGELRPLDIPNVDNRAVQKAVAMTLHSYFRQDGHLQTADAREWKTDAGYCRTGRGHLRMLATLKDRYDAGGLPVAVIFDIRKAFERVRVEDVLRACGQEGHDLRRTDGLADRATALENERKTLFGNDDHDWQEHDRKRPQKPLRGFGTLQQEQQAFWSLFERLLRGAANRTIEIAQGGPLSPLALELMLDVFLDSPLQEALSEMPPAWFGRYVDDGVVLVPDHESGLRVVQVVEKLLASLGLEMKSLKGSQSRVVDLTAGEEASILGLVLQHTDSGLAYRIPSGAIEAASDSVARLSATADSFTRVRSFFRSFVFAHAPALPADAASVFDLSERLGASVSGACSPNWFSSVVGGSS